VEVIIKGQGEVVFSLIDRTRKTLIQKKITISGSPNVQAKTDVPLIVETTDGEVPVAPVLVRQSNREQQITFDDCEPSSFTKRRCQEIGSTSNVIKEAEGGKVQLIDKYMFHLSGITGPESA
jgi:hypothetical protein